MAQRRTDPERQRLDKDARREQNWKRFGPYLAERQWGTVREDYSEDGDTWGSFTHEHAVSRAYRWGEDGLLGFTDRQCRLCLAPALWNGNDPILKERLFGLTNPEGNHGEDVKELYYYLDATPTSSYVKALYKYPHAAFPYAKLREENGRRGRQAREFELLETGVFDGDRYFDVLVEYAKAAPDDLLICYTVTNRGPAAARLELLPQLWYRNTWSWGCEHEGCGVRPQLKARGSHAVEALHPSLGHFVLLLCDGPDGAPPELLFTENETNAAKLFGAGNATPYVKDAFHEYVVRGRRDAVNPRRIGTKMAARYACEVPAGASVTLRLRLVAAKDAPAAQAGGGNGRRATGARLGKAFDAVFGERIAEADAFYAALLPAGLSTSERQVARQAYAGLLHTRQFYHLVVADWLDGDPDQPAPPPGHTTLRNTDWRHLYNRDVLSVPDKWEYPYYCAWDLAFHMIPFARLDPEFAKQQLLLFLREWYLHPNGQLPAYEFNFSDVNPPVHAWAVWEVYETLKAEGREDRVFLSRCFQKLLLNFTWWVNRKDPHGNNIFAGGFLGLDNIGVFDRSQPLPTGGHLEQADGTAWMAFYSLTMLKIALELAPQDKAAEDMASKFFEHFVAITDALNTLNGTGLWNDEDGFYYDALHVDGRSVPLRVRSLVGLVPLFAAEVFDEEVIDRLPGFKKRFEWFLDNRRDLARHIASFSCDASGAVEKRLFASTPRAHLERVLRYLLDETEFLAPHGIRSLSRVHRDRPYVFHADGRSYEVGYVPGESDSGLFGGNSNWRGPVWLPMNYLLLHSLLRHHRFYSDSLTIEFPTGSGRELSLEEVTEELAARLVGLFVPGRDGARACHGEQRLYAHDPHFRDLLLFHEYFDGDTGRGLGASHQTGWTALIVSLLEGLGGKTLPPPHAEGARGRPSLTL